MRRVMVRYTVKPGRAAENERCVEQVFAELARVAPAGVHYQTFRLEDGLTFVHVYAQDSDDEPGPLPSLPAFRAFRAGLEERCESAPVRTVLHEVGAYHASSAASSFRGERGRRAREVEESRGSR
jgi:hypothetical protein